MTTPAVAEEQSHLEKKHHVAEAKPKAVRRLVEARRHRDMTEIHAAALHHHPHHRHLAAREGSITPIGTTIGEREVGRASWYGGHHLGRRTASGERLDSIHDTAAHRSLPLQSLARVTNLDNGRSVIVRVTDRGPVSHDLVIDLSPSAAAQLRMRQAGIVPVSVEPVVQAADAAP